MINAGWENPRHLTGWTRYSNGTTTQRRYIDTGSKSHDQRRRSAKIVRIGIYFFLASLLTCAILVIMS